MIPQDEEAGDERSRLFSSLVTFDSFLPLLSSFFSSSQSLLLYFYSLLLSSALLTSVQLLFLLSSLPIPYVSFLCLPRYIATACVTPSPHTTLSAVSLSVRNSGRNGCERTESAEIGNSSKSNSAVASRCFFGVQTCSVMHN